MKISEEDKSPPDELAEQWRQESCDNQELANLIEQIQYIAAKAAAWGREQERAELLKHPSEEMQVAGASAIRFETTNVNKLWTANAVFKAMVSALTKAKEVADAKQ